MAEGSKYGPYSKLFFFVMEQDSCEKSGEITSTSIEKYEYTPILKQNTIPSDSESVGLFLAKIELVWCSDEKKGRFT